MQENSRRFTNGRSGKMVRKRVKFFEGERYLQMEDKLWKNHACTLKGERDVLWDLE